MEPEKLFSSAIARNGVIEGIRKAITDGADPKFEDSWALSMAAIRLHTDCVRLLIPVSDVKVARAVLEKNDYHDAVALLDSILQEEALKAKHLKPTDERARAAL